MKQPTANAQPRSANGLVCRNCGCRHFQVIYTRRAAQGRIVRRRECRHCGRRLTTWEVAINQTQDLA